MQRCVGIAIIVMGLSGLVAEILLLRELLIVFSGNELSIGIILANWLVLEAFGSFVLGRISDKSKNALEIFTLITILFSVSLLAAIFLTRILKNLIGVSVGESVGLVPIFSSSFLILLPVSTLHGALFTLSCRIYSSKDTSVAGKVYVYETIGTIIGGIVCTYLFIPYLNVFQTALGITLLNSIVCLGLVFPSWRIGRLWKILCVTLSGLCVVSAYLLLSGQADQLHRYSIQTQWKHLRVVHYQNSPYGNITVIENQGQYIFFEDGEPSLITPIPDWIAVEEFVHLPLLAHPAPAQILIVSGGAGGVINEMLQHPSVKTIEYVELDPLILSLLRKFSTPLTESELTDDRVQIRPIDGRLLLKTTPHTYDLIVVGIAEPSNLQTNRFFTREFFSLAKNKLNPAGILVLTAPGSLTWLNEELKQLNSCIFHTLQNVFPYVRVIPGDGRNIFLASDSRQVLELDKVQGMSRLSERNITTSTLAPWHIESKLHHGWQNWFAQFIERGTQKINSDFQPLGLFYNLSHWNALFAPTFGVLFKQFEKIDLWMILFLFCLFLLFYFSLRSRRNVFSASISFSIVTTGFAGMLFDLIVIFAFQVIYGYVFSWIGILVTFFMVGAACGAMVTTMIPTNQRNSLKLFIKIELALIGISIGLPFAFEMINVFATSPSAFFIPGILFLIISFICGLGTGSQFPLANKLYLQNNTSLSQTAGLLYAADLLGGWLGGIIGAVVLLPVLGLVGTCITVMLLKLASGIGVAAQSQSASYSSP